MRQNLSSNQENKRVFIKYRKVVETALSATLCPNIKGSPFSVLNPDIKINEEAI